MNRTALAPRLLCLLLAACLLFNGCGFAPNPSVSTDGAAAADEADGLSVHFIDVGQADCMLLECGESTMLIDGGNVADSQLVVSYLQAQGLEELTYVVSTHPHEDHAGGLAAVLAVFPVEEVYAPTAVYASACYDNFLRYVDQQRLTLQKPAPGDSLALGGAEVTFLGPVREYPETNNQSIVLRVDYGDTSFLFTGDMERDAETELLESGCELRADVLKVGHHGSSTSTGARFLEAVDPWAAVISCGKDNDYGHPHRETLSLLLGRDLALYRTDRMGTIVAESDGTDIYFSWENTQVLPDRGQETGYVGNRKSQRFHLPSCTALPAEQNQIFFESYADALEAGYTPCSRCMG